MNVVLSTYLFLEDDDTDGKYITIRHLLYSFLLLHRWWMQHISMTGDRIRLRSGQNDVLEMKKVIVFLLLAAYNIIFQNLAFFFLHNKREIYFITHGYSCLSFKKIDESSTEILIATLLFYRFYYTINSLTHTIKYL